MAKKDIEAKKEESKAVMNLDDMDIDDGLDEVSKDDIIIPRLKLMQSNSEMVTEEGVPPGKIADTVTAEFFDKVRILPLKFSKRIVHRAEGGKGELFGEIIGSYGPEDAGKAPIDIRNMFSPQGYYSQDAEKRKMYTLVFSILALNISSVVANTKDLKDKDPAEIANPENIVVMNFINTNLKPAQQIISTMKKKRMKLFQVIYEINVQSKKNNKGSWYVLSPTIMKFLMPDVEHDARILQAVISLIREFQKFDAKDYVEAEAEDISSEIEDGNM